MSWEIVNSVLIVLNFFLAAILLGPLAERLGDFAGYLIVRYWYGIKPKQEILVAD